MHEADDCSVCLACADVWLSLNSMPTARCTIGLAEQSGDLHAVGGYLFGVGYFAVHERYDAATGRHLP